MATSQEFSEAQLEAARKPLWHQAGEPVLTQEAAREFIDSFGLVQFAPGRLQMTAPSLVEATLGEANAAPSAAQSQVARDLVGRLVADGLALPLNLLGGGGDMPDFIVATGAFRYIFTLRGDKSWKQAPATSGGAKVSPLALRVYETLSEKGALTAAELAAELGREVTEAAIVRALGELWQMLRVIPLLAQGDNPTLWELTTRRFTRHIKAGVNAGQPTALSALVSLYLQQAIAGTTDEIETFLSPLAARSRVREVLHALVSARELSEVVVAGKTLVHVAGELPEFAPEPQAELPEPVEGEAAPEQKKPARREFSETETPEPGRILKFERGATAPRTREAGNVAFKRKPFGREQGEGKPQFNKPWNEERPARRPRAAEGEDRPKRSFGGGDRERRPFQRNAAEGGERRPFAPRGERKPFGDRERKPFNPDRPRRSFAAEGEDRPRRTSGPGDRERRPFKRPEGEGGGERRPFAPRTGERKPFGGGADRPRRSFGEGEDRPRRTAATGDRERRPFRRTEGEGGERKPFAPRGERKPFNADRPRRNFGEGEDRPKRAFGGGDRERRPFRRTEGEGGERRPSAPRGDRKPFNADRPRRNFGEGEDRPKRAFGTGDRERRPFRRTEGEGSERRLSVPRGDRKPFGAKPGGARKPFAGKPGAKPFGRPAAGKGKPGGSKPTTRRPKRETEE